MAKPPVPPPRPGTSPPTPAPRPRIPTLHEDNPFLLASESNISSSKIDAGWGSADDAPESLDNADFVPASVESPAAPPAPAAARAPVAAPAPDATPAPSPPSVAPIKKRSRGKVLAFVLLPMLVLAGAGFAYQQQEAARLAKLQAAASHAPPPPVEEPPSTAEPPPPPTHTADPPPPSASVEAKKPAAAAPAASYQLEQRAYLDATAVPAGRKIIVDGRVVGTAPRRLQVHCGAHRVQIGDLDPESISFPCGGGEVSFTQ